MAEAHGASDVVYLRGLRVRLRPLEREGLPRYQEPFSEPEINLDYALGFWDDILVGIAAEEWWSRPGSPQQPGRAR